MSREEETLELIGDALHCFNKCNNKKEEDISNFNKAIDTCKYILKEMLYKKLGIKMNEEVCKWIRYEDESYDVGWIAECQDKTVLDSHYEKEEFRYKFCCGCGKKKLATFKQVK